MTATSAAFKGIVSPLLRSPLPSPTIYDVCGSGNSYSALERCVALPSNVEQSRKKELARLYHIPIHSRWAIMGGVP
jgi:hypothetical protein